MKYKITKHGQKLWHEKEGNILSQEALRVRFGEEFSIEGAIELGLLVRLPARFELRRGHDKTRIYIFRSEECGGENHSFSKQQVDKLEHCINNEWYQIPECFEEMIRTLDDFQASSFVNLRDFINVKIAVLKNTD